MLLQTAGGGGAVALARDDVPPGRAPRARTSALPWLLLSLLAHGLALLLPLRPAPRAGAFASPIPIAWLGTQASLGLPGPEAAVVEASQAAVAPAIAPKPAVRDRRAVTPRVPPPAHASEPAPVSASATSGAAAPANALQRSMDAGAAGADADARSAGPLSVALRRLPRLLTAPPPTFPLAARRRGAQGTSEVKLRVASDGSVIEVRLHRSAGDRALDEAALEAVRRWRFEPSPEDPGRAGAWFLVPIEFRLR